MVDDTVVSCHVVVCLPPERGCFGEMESGHWKGAEATTVIWICVMLCEDEVDDAKKEKSVERGRARQAKELWKKATRSDSFQETGRHEGLLVASIFCH